MKFFLQKTLSMAIAVAVLYPSISSAENDFASGMATTGWTVGLVSSGLFLIKGDAPACNYTFGTTTLGAAPILGGPRPIVTTPTISDCSARNAHLKEQKIYAFGMLAGLGAVIVGEGIQYFGKGKETTIPFQVRPIQNGIAIEREGLSFSAAATGKVRLEKRWEF